MKHTHTCRNRHTHAHTHNPANCQERCLERKDPCHLLSRPASLFGLSNCQSPLSTTSPSEKQMSACHFSRHLTFLFFPRPPLKVERPSPVSLCGIHLLLRSLLLFVFSSESQGPIVHIRHDYCNSLSPSSAR